MYILTDDALIELFEWLGKQLKSKLKRPDLQTDVIVDDDAAGLYLYPPAWRMPGLPEEYVAYSLYWSGDHEDAFYYQIYAPLRNRFARYDELLDLIRQPLKDAGFPDHRKTEPSFPFYKEVPGLEFSEPLTVDPKQILAAILKGNGFQDMMKIETLIDKTIHQLPAPPPPAERKLTPSAFLDTEWTGNGSRRKLTQLAIKVVEYDAVDDRIAGISGQYVMKINGRPDKEKIGTLLKRAERIIAHNFNGDQTLLEQVVPGIPKGKWLDSCHGIDWPSLAGAESKAQNELLLTLGLDNKEQEHSAEIDVNDLIRILAQKDKSRRTYLSRLLETVST
jgi:hypothetical protein